MSPLLRGPIETKEQCILSPGTNCRSGCLVQSIINWHCSHSYIDSHINGEYLDRDSTVFPDQLLGFISCLTDARNILKSVVVVCGMNLCFTKTMFAHNHCSAESFYLQQSTVWQCNVLHLSVLNSSLLPCSDKHHTKLFYSNRSGFISYTLNK